MSTEIEFKKPCKKCKVDVLLCDCPPKQTAPARFRRITPRTKVTAPCVLLKLNESVIPHVWESITANTEFAVDVLRDRFTHWLPIEFPEVRR